MAIFLGHSLLIILILAFALMFTREKNTKLDYLKRVGVVFSIGICSAMLAIPIYGPIMGFSAIFLNAVVLGTLLQFKNKRESLNNEELK